MGAPDAARLRPRSARAVGARGSRLALSRGIGAFQGSRRRAFRPSALRAGALAAGRRHLDLRERRDPSSHRGEKQRASACRARRRAATSFNGFLLRSTRWKPPSSLMRFSSLPAIRSRRRAGSCSISFSPCASAIWRRSSPTGPGSRTTFRVADILMSDVLRMVDHFEALAEFPACRAYVVRAMARPAFQKAHADQMAHFAAAD